MGKILSLEQCMEELSDIARDKENCSASERIRAIGMLTSLKNESIENQKNSDNSLNIKIDYGDVKEYGN